MAEPCDEVAAGPDPAELVLLDAVGPRPTSAHEQLGGLEARAVPSPAQDPASALAAAPTEKRGKKERSAPKGQRTEIFLKLMQRRSMAEPIMTAVVAPTAAAAPISTRSTLPCEAWCEEMNLGLTPSPTDLHEFKLLCGWLDRGKVKIEELRTLEKLRKIGFSYATIRRHVYGDAACGVQPHSYLSLEKPPRVRGKAWGKRAASEAEIQQQKQLKLKQEQESKKPCNKMRVVPVQHDHEEELLEVGRGDGDQVVPEATEANKHSEQEVWDVSEEEAVKLNLRVRRLRGLDASTAVEPLKLPLSEQELEELTAAIRQGFASGQQSSSGISCQWQDPVTGQLLVAKGYRKYGRVHGKHIEAEQFKVTCVLGPESQLWKYSRVLPHLSTILAYIEQQAPNRSVAFVHLLDQNSNQAKFSWHVDNSRHDLGYGDIELSFVFLLTATASSMQVAGKEVFAYAGAGSGCMFHAALWHASVDASPGTVKVAVFLNKK